MEMTGASIIIDILEREGITMVAGIPGSSNLPLYDALGASNIRHILARHEQAAGFIAGGIARRTGEVAVCFATSGPGVTNLLTAIADAKLDSIPLVAITGQVPRAMIGTDAFQEIDSFGLSLPITKHSVMVNSAEELLTELPKAFDIARSGRPGPVLVDVPKDVQTELCSFDHWPETKRFRQTPPPPDSIIDQIWRELNKAERPLIYAGAGCAASQEAASSLTAFARSFGIPVTYTLHALGAFPSDDPLCLGMIGMHGTRTANKAAADCDLLLALGARFDDRATGKLEAFAPNADIIHIDIDPAELGKLKKATLSLVADAGKTCAALTKKTLSREKERSDSAASKTRRQKRLDWAASLEAMLRQEDGPDNAPENHPVRFLATLSRSLPPDMIVSTDVGQHQMWAAQAIKPKTVRSFLSSGGLGSMGFGLPSAIGAALAAPGKRVLCISGDGSLLMNIQELATLSELGLPVTILVMDNASLGLVRQQQDLLYNGRHTATRFKAQLDFTAIASAFGIASLDLADSDNPQVALGAALRGQGPLLVRLPVDEEADVYPMVPPGASNNDMVGTYGEAEKAKAAQESADTLEIEAESA